MKTYCYRVKLIFQDNGWIDIWRLIKKDSPIWEICEKKISVYDRKWIENENEKELKNESSSLIFRTSGPP